MFLWVYVSHVWCDTYDTCDVPMECSGVRVAGSCELPDAVLGTKPGSFAGAVDMLYWWVNSLFPLHLTFWGRVSHCFCSSSVPTLGTCLSPPTPELSYRHVPSPLAFVWFWGSKLRLPCLCTASTSPTQPSSQTQLSSFKKGIQWWQICSNFNACHI